MKFLGLILLLGCFCSTQVKARASDLGSNRAVLAKMADKLKYTGSEALISYRQALSKFNSQLQNHRLVKRNIESAFDNMKIGSLPGPCSQDPQQHINDLKSKAVQNYHQCSSEAVFRAVGDSVQIVTVSLQLFAQIFKSIEDVTVNFNGCYNSSSFHSLVCTVEQIETFVVDTKNAVDQGLAYGTDIKSLAQDVHNIIYICQHKNETNPTLLVKNLVNQCAGDNVITSSDL